jgi:hypothetical protein
MCLVCTDWIKGSLSTPEAWRNLNETRTEDSTQEEIDHYFEVAEMLTKDQEKDQ